MRLARGACGFGGKLVPGDRQALWRYPALAALMAWLVMPPLTLNASPQKKKKEEQTQVLQLPKDLPATVECETSRLAFYLTPLSARGLLSQQIRDAVKALEHKAGGDTILKIRAFVAGPGDVRRVRDLISELYTERQKPLPALSLIRCGGLPLEGAQVILEATAAARKTVNPAGVAFISAQPAWSESGTDPVEPLLRKSLESLGRALSAAGSHDSDVLRVTCYLSSLRDLPSWRTLVESRFVRAAADFVQTQRAPVRGLAACEAVARLASDPGAFQSQDVDGLPHEAGQAQMALLPPLQRLVLTGSQVSFGHEAKDAQLAFSRLARELEQAGSSSRNVVFAHYYPLAQSIAQQIRQVRSGFFDASRPPAGTMLIFEGLTSMDAGFAMDVVAVK